MKTYKSPQITEYSFFPSDIIAVSIINGGSAGQDTPVQVKDDNSFSTDWGNVFTDEDIYE